MRVVLEKEWETTLFYLTTLSIVFILGCILRLILA